MLLILVMLFGSMSSHFKNTDWCTIRRIVDTCMCVVCAGIIPLIYIELLASVLMFVLGIVLLIGINYVSSNICLSLSVGSCN